MAHRNRPPQKCLPRPALLATALLLLGGFPQSSRGQSPADKTPVGLSGASSLQDAIRQGRLFSAVAPVPEDALKRLDGTPNEQSFTVPLTVDRANNRLYVQAKINNKSVRLILDTAGGPTIGLSEADAREIGLTRKRPAQVLGSQGTETETIGLAQRMTIGNLTLGQIAVTYSHNASIGYTLGLEVFVHYRVTLDFVAQTMTLTRGGVLTLPQGGSALSIPFDYAGGKAFVPVHVLNQDGWALLDSGSDATTVSVKAAQAAAVQLPAADSRTVDVDGVKFGFGSSVKKTKITWLEVPVPISINNSQQDWNFSTFSQLGMSDIDDVLDTAFDAGGNINATLGFPFFVQFHRVIIDYPNRTLVLEYPIKDSPLKVEEFSTNHNQAWPGYKWIQKGYAWVEVPDDKNPTPPQATTASGGTVVTTANGSASVTRNGVTKVYPLPPGYGITVSPDSSVRISPVPHNTKAAGQTGGT